MQVTLFEGSTKETTVEASQIEIHDLWHDAQYMKDIANRKTGKVKDLERVADRVLDVWHIAHAMKKVLASQ